MCTRFGLERPLGRTSRLTDGTDVITRLERRGIVVLLSGIKPRHDQVLSALGIADHLRAGGLIFADTPAAIRHARGLVHIVPEAA